MSQLTHLNRKGEAAMVDVSAKPPPCAVKPSPKDERSDSMRAQ